MGTREKILYPFGFTILITIFIILNPIQIYGQEQTLPCYSDFDDSNLCLSFDQPEFIVRHWAVVIFTVPPNSGISEPPTVEVWSSSNPGDKLSLSLFKYDPNSNIYVSEYFKVRHHGTSVLLDPPRIPSPPGTTLIVDHLESGLTTSVLVYDDTTDIDDLPPGMVFIDPDFVNCSEYGGDVDDDGICDDWENWAGTVSGPQSNLVYDRGPGLYINYPEDPQGNNRVYHYPCAPSITGDCPDPLHKDLYLEINYMQSHRPNPLTLDAVIQSFANARMEKWNRNPDEADGINLHIQVNNDFPIVHVYELPQQGMNPTPPLPGNPGFWQVKAAHNGTQSDRDIYTNWWGELGSNQKQQVFHYALFGHHESGTSATGWAELFGNDIFISLGGFAIRGASIDRQQGTLMHELGHNLGLLHGGAPHIDDIKCKPRHISVMSYSRQFSDFVPDRPLDFQRSPMGWINENTLSEMNTLWNYVDDVVGEPNMEIVFGGPDGLPPDPTLVTHPPRTGEQIDWNQTGVYDPDPLLGVPYNINFLKDLDGNVVCDDENNDDNYRANAEWKYVDLSTQLTHTSNWQAGRVAVQPTHIVITDIAQSEGSKIIWISDDSITRIGKYVSPSNGGEIYDCPPLSKIGIITAENTTSSMQDPGIGHETHQLALILPPNDKIYTGILYYNATEPVQLVSLRGPLAEGEDEGIDIWTPDGETKFALTLVDPGSASGYWQFNGNALALHTMNPTQFDVLEYAVKYQESNDSEEATEKFYCLGQQEEITVENVIASRTSRLDVLERAFVTLPIEDFVDDDKDAHLGYFLSVFDEIRPKVVDGNMTLAIMKLNEDVKDKLDEHIDNSSTIERLEHGITNIQSSYIHGARPVAPPGIYALSCEGDPPLKQIKNCEIAPENVVCKPGLYLLMVPERTNWAACVTPETAEDLSSRGWQMITDLTLIQK